MSGGYRRIELPFIPRESWRDRAACTPRAAERLWDDRVEGETDVQRRERHRQAKAVCKNQCPVRQECSDSADWRFDEGVRGGHSLPPLGGQHTEEEAETARLLRKGWPLDQAAG